MVLLSVAAGVRAVPSLSCLVEVDDEEKSLLKHPGGKKCLDSAPVQRLHLPELDSDVMAIVH